jgi:3-hydroxyacyl-CoA dehydrogenase
MTVGVVGDGLMGSGNAVTSARGGRTVVVELSPRAADAAGDAV